MKTAPRVLSDWCNSVTRPRHHTSSSGHLVTPPWPALVPPVWCN